MRSMHHLTPFHITLLLFLGINTAYKAGESSIWGVKHDHAMAGGPGRLVIAAIVYIDVFYTHQNSLWKGGRGQQ
jgi:hypothetical protein